MLAVDLSLASLAYAKRKTVELGRSNIEYGQADILKLGSLGRSFDLIESSGVLHHLADPLAGWRVLLSLLRPGGFMMIGLYSEIARAEIVKARAFIAEQGYGATAGDIRQCRQALIAGGAEFSNVVASGDFFSTSGCRDLLFHVQEHRFSIPEIASFIAQNGLAFVGFDLDSLHAAAIHHEIPARHSHERPCVLGDVRARPSGHVFRHVPILGAKDVMTRGPRRPAGTRWASAGLERTRRH